MCECKLQWLAMQQQQHKSVCGHSERRAFSMHPHSPSDLLIVHASKLSQKLSTYTPVYTVRHYIYMANVMTKTNKQSIESRDGRETLNLETKTRLRRDVVNLQDVKIHAVLTFFTFVTSWCVNVIINYRLATCIHSSIGHRTSRLETETLSC